MLRSQLNDALKTAMRDKDQRALATIRLILAALKDRDIAARGDGNPEGIGEDEILAMLQKMVKQREESIRMYEQGGRCELAGQEAEEVEVIRRFLPRPLDERQTEQAIRAAIEEIGAASIKDMGQVMAKLRETYPGRMDFGSASQKVKAILTG